MARRRRQEIPENHDRWLISYADFITLLFAFFVVMYAVSSVNEGKYRVLSDSLGSAFSTEDSSMRHSPRSNGVLDLQSGVFNSGADLLGLRTNSLIPELAGDAGTGMGAGEGDGLENLADGLENAVASFVDDDLIAVRRNKSWIEVELNSSLLFTSGEAVVSDEALPIMRTIAGLLRPHTNPIHVEGFTDNVPINRRAFPSNWELSAARAASVVNLFSQYGVDPLRMAAVGFGEFHPIADNRTRKGRERNRRVVLVILADQRARRAVNAAMASRQLQ